VEQLIILLSDIRAALRHCVKLESESTGFVLSTIADMVDEMCTFELTDVPAMLGDKPSMTPAQPLSGSVTAPARSLSSLTLPSRPRSPSPPRAVPSSAISRQVGRGTSPGPTHSRQGTGVVPGQPSPSRGRSLAAPTISTPRDSQRMLQSSSRAPSLAPSGGAASSALPCGDPGARVSLDANVTRYKSVSGFPSAGFYAPTSDPGNRALARANSIDMHRLDHRVRDSDRSTSPGPQRWVGQSVRSDRSVERAALMHSATAPAQRNGGMVPSQFSSFSQQRQASAARDRQPGQPSVEVHTRESQQMGKSPQSSPGITTRMTLPDSRSLLSRSQVVLPAAPGSLASEAFAAGAGSGTAQLGSMRRSYSLDRRGESRSGSAVAPTLRSAVAPTSISRGERQHLERSPRSDVSTNLGSAQQHPSISGQLRAAAGGPLSSSSPMMVGPAHLQRGVPAIWLPPPRELVSRPLGGGARSGEDGQVQDAQNAASMASRLTEAMAGLSAAVAAAQNASATQSAGQTASSSSGAEVLEKSGDGDVGAGPPYPALDAPTSYIMASETALEGSMSPLVYQERLVGQARRGVAGQEMKASGLEAHGDEHEKLRERIKNLEESLQRLGRESLERAKLGMEKLAEKYFPKVQNTTGRVPHSVPNGTTPGLVLPRGAIAGMAQASGPHFRSSYPAALPSMPPMTIAPSMPSVLIPMATEPMVLAGGAMT